MNDDLLNLIKISEIDRRASAKEPEIAAIEDELNSKVKELNNLEWDLEEIRNDIKRSRVEIGNSELSIAENKEKIEQLDVKMANAKSERELRALDAENGIAKERIAFANQIIAELEAKIANFREKESEVEGKMNELREIIKTTSVSVDERTGVIKNELRGIFDEKEVIAKNIDHKIIVFYEKIRKWAKETSVVSVKKQACSGCFIRINDRVFLELLKAETITTCPHCGRILYLEASEIKRDAERKAQKVSKKSTKKAESTKATKSASSKTSSAKKSTKDSSAKSAKTAKSSAKTPVKSAKSAKDSSAKTTKKAATKAKK